MSPEEALRRVLEVDGVDIPRLLASEALIPLATRIAEGDADGRAVAPQAAEAARTLWPVMGPPLIAALGRAAATGSDGDREAIAVAEPWLEGEPDNPLMLALVARSGAALAAAMDRSAGRFRSADTTLAAAEDAGGAIAVATAVGESVLDLLDLDVEDYEPELVAYVGRDQTPDALDVLARETGDADLRGLARTVVTAVPLDDAPGAALARDELAAGPPPADAAEDAVWVPAVLALAEEAIAVAIAADPPGDEPAG